MQCVKVRISQSLEVSLGYFYHWITNIFCFSYVRNKILHWECWLFQIILSIMISNIYAIGCCSPSILFCDQYRSLTSKNHFIFMQLVVCMVQSVSQLRWQVNTITDGRQHIQYNTQLNTGNVHWQFKKVVVVSPIERGTTDLFLDNPFLCCNTHPFFQLCTSLHPDNQRTSKTYIKAGRFSLCLSVISLLCC